jgi:hypothetical protein
MPKNVKRNPVPGFVVFRRVGERQWECLGEVERQGGLTAREARSRAIQEATLGKARSGEVYAAVLRSEWNIAQDWRLPASRATP